MKVYYFNCPHCSEEQQFTDSKRLGTKVYCDDCNGKVELPNELPYFEEKPARPKKKTKKSSTLFVTTVVTLTLIVIIGLMLPPLGMSPPKDSGKEKKDSESQAKKGSKSLTKTDKENYINPMLNVKKSSTFDPSPVKTPHQWIYARVAKTYSNPAGMYPLQAGNAKLIDKNGNTPTGERSIKYHQNNDALINWHVAGEGALWKLAPIEISAEYHIYSYYGAPNDSANGEFKIKIADKTFKSKVKSTGAYNKYQQHFIGSIKLEKGMETSVKMLSEKINPGTGLMDLKALEIVP